MTATGSHTLSRGGNTAATSTQRLPGWLPPALLGVSLLLAGCDAAEKTAAGSEPLLVRADQPFSLRLDPAGAAGGQRFSLHYRRNEGSWEPLAAETFPYPAKELALDFSGDSGNGPETAWNLVQGEASALAWQREEQQGFLRMTTRDSALLALADYQTDWDPTEFKTTLRLSPASAAGILFGYRDADNHYRVELAAAGELSLVQRANGADKVLQREAVSVQTGQWLELAVEWEGSEVTLAYEWDPYLQGVEITRDLGTAIPASRAGIYLPGNSGVDLLQLEVSGQAHTPRVSIVSNSDLARGEGEFPLVIRYFSDQAAVNEPGDRFDFRLVDSNGHAVAAAQATVVLEVPDGHLGGTFVETPTRIGPWEAANGDLYFIMEPSETDNVLMMVTSTDGGKSWRETDGANRPETGDLEGVGSVLVDGSIHILHQTSEHVFYHRFRTSDHPQPDSWDIRDERLASPVEPPVQVADIAVRGDGSLVGVYGNRHKILYRVRSAEGQWSEETVVDPDEDRDLSGPVLVRGRDDIVHLAYTGLDGTAWYRRILPNGELTPRQPVASGLGTEVQDAGGILPLVYLPDSDTVSILYRLDNGELWERRVSADGELGTAVQATRRPVVRNAADAEQVGADAIAHGTDVHLLFIEDGSGRLFHSWRDGAGDWSEPTLVVDGEEVLWVRGTLIKQTDEGAVYGYVYDAGSQGGSGMNRYAELPLPSR